MFLRLLFLFVTVPLVELSLLLALADATDWLSTLLIVVVTGAFGAWLARRQGWHTYQRIHQELASGTMPTESVMDALMIFVAGALLLTPGILTDCFGITLLLPPCRRFYRRRMVHWLKTNVKIKSFSTNQPSPARDSVIDSYVVDREDDQPS